MFQDVLSILKPTEKNGVICHNLAKSAIDPFYKPILVEFLRFSEMCQRASIIVGRINSVKSINSSCKRTWPAEGSRAGWKYQQSKWMGNTMKHQHAGIGMRCVIFHTFMLMMLYGGMLKASVDGINRQILQNISQFCLACSSLLLLIYHYTNVVIIISISITMNGNNHHNCHYHHHVLTMIIIQWCYHYHHNYHEIIVIWFWSSLFMMLSLMLSFIITIITTIMVIFVDDFGSQNDDLTMFCGSPRGRHLAGRFSENKPWRMLRLGASPWGDMLFFFVV